MLRLGVDIGTSNTAAVLRTHDGTRPLLFDGALLLPTAVFADEDRLLVGADAVHAGVGRPQCLEPHPKRCVDDGSVLLGEREVPVEQLFGAVLRRVADEARALHSEPIGALTLTAPVAWGPRRRAVLRSAAADAGLPEPELRDEPVAAAAYFTGVGGDTVPDGGPVLVYDLGAGTFDATVIRRTGDTYDVLAARGLPDAGGLDIDAAIVASVNAGLRPASSAWSRLRHPVSPAEVRARRALWDGVRTAKEALSRTGSAYVYVPLLEAEVPLGREQFEALAGPTIERTVATVRAVLADVGMTAGELVAVYLVGGSVRIPLVSTALHRALDMPPLLVDQPDLAVALGSLAHHPQPPPQPPPSPVPVPVPAPPAREDPWAGREPPAVRRVRLAELRRRRFLFAAAVIVALVLVICSAAWPTVREP
jgi:molecular chaperone DnaK (HSP70)